MILIKEYLTNLPLAWVFLTIKGADLNQIFQIFNFKGADLNQIFQIFNFFWGGAENRGSGDRLLGGLVCIQAAVPILLQLSTVSSY